MDDEEKLRLEKRLSKEISDFKELRDSFIDLKNENNLLLMRMRELISLSSFYQADFRGSLTAIDEQLTDRRNRLMELRGE